MTRNIKGWAIGFIIIIVILSSIVFYYRYYYNPRYQVDDWYSLTNAEGAKNITSSFLNNSSLTQYHTNNVTKKYRGKIIDFNVDLYDQHNNSIGQVLIHGNTARIAAITINGIEIDGKNHSKITHGLWKKISTSDNSSYCHCASSLTQSLSEEEKNLLIKNQKFEIKFENSTILIGRFPMSKINDLLNNGKIKSIENVE